MILVKDILESTRAMLGGCDDDMVYDKRNEAVELLQNEGHWDANVGLVDICTQGCAITLPDDVDVPLAVNVGGMPTDFRNKWFEFHLNGPGTECGEDMTNFAWVDDGRFPTFRDPRLPSTLMAIPDTDEGSSFSIRVYGYDQNNKEIWTPDCYGVLTEGFDVPVLYPTPVPTTIRVKRITRVSKPVSRGFIRLLALDPGASGCSAAGNCAFSSGTAPGQTLIGYYKPTDTEPQYRRISISGVGANRLCECDTLSNWVRMRFRKKAKPINDPMDLIFLESTTALKMALKAIKFYEDDLADQYEKYTKMAVNALNKKQKMNSGPNQIRIQFERGVVGSMIEENMI